MTIDWMQERLPLLSRKTRSPGCSKRYTVADAHHNQARVGRVLMACGRDAVDVALTTSFGTTTLKEFSRFRSRL